MPTEVPRNNQGSLLRLFDHQSCPFIPVCSTSPSSYAHLCNTISLQIKSSLMQLSHGWVQTWTHFIHVNAHVRLGLDFACVSSFGTSIHERPRSAYPAKLPSMFVAPRLSIYQPQIVVKWSTVLLFGDTAGLGCSLYALLPLSLQNAIGQPRIVEECKQNCRRSVLKL